VFVRNAAKGPVVAPPDFTGGSASDEAEPETVSVAAGESEGGAA